jgi:hypothetical protein
MKFIPSSSKAIAPASSPCRQRRYRKCASCYLAGRGFRSRCGLNFACACDVRVFIGRNGVLVYKQEFRFAYTCKIIIVVLMSAVTALSNPASMFEAQVTKIVS